MFSKFGEQNPRGPEENRTAGGPGGLGLEVLPAMVPCTSGFLPGKGTSDYPCMSYVQICPNV